MAEADRPRVIRPVPKGHQAQGRCVVWCHVHGPATALGHPQGTGAAQGHRVPSEHQQPFAVQQHKHFSHALGRVRVQDGRRSTLRE